MALIAIESIANSSIYYTDNQYSKDIYYRGKKYTQNIKLYINRNIC